jgi:hypothetical protein
MLSSRPPPLGPEWLAHRFDPATDTIHFAVVPRSARRRAPFLTDDELKLSGKPTVVERAAARKVTDDRAPVHFIFHSAYCCSTLLANALDRPGVASTLKEPVILNDIVGWRHRGADPARIREALDDSLSLLARPFAGDPCMIVKPSNVVNTLAPAMLAMRPTAKTVLLYAPLRVFLASIARKGIWGRLWVRDLLRKQLRDGAVDLGFDVEDYFLLTDIQVAAVGWLAQHQLFTRLATQLPDRVRTLDSERLVAQPAATLTALAKLLGLALTPDHIEKIVAGDAFSTNAKDGRPFRSADRIADRDASFDTHGDEIDKITVWAETVARNAGLAFILPGALVS